MSVIELDKSVVENVMSDIFTRVTKTLTGIDVSINSGKSKRITRPLSAVILSKGVFASKSICVFSRNFMEAVTKRMNIPSDASDEDVQLYFKEYLNITYGRIISSLNGILKRPSRFLIPVIIPGVYKESFPNTLSNFCEITLHCEFGDMKITTAYEVLPEHSNN